MCSLTYLCNVLNYIAGGQLHVMCVTTFTLNFGVELTTRIASASYSHSYFSTFLSYRLQTRV